LTVITYAVFAWQGGAIVIGVTPLQKATVPEVPPAFTEPPDPPELKLCRPCSDKNVIEKSGVSYYGAKETERALIHACDGNGCQCALCAIAQTAREMTDEWDLFDRADQWRD
jgi:hypothetical protein